MIGKNSIYPRLCKARIKGGSALVKESLLRNLVMRIAIMTSEGKNDYKRLFQRM